MKITLIIESASPNRNRLSWQFWKPRVSRVKAHIRLDGGTLKMTTDRSLPHSLEFEGYANSEPFVADFLLNSDPSDLEHK